MAKQFEKLEAFVHMSSVYANSDQAFIEERVYADEVAPQKVMNLLEWMEDEWMELASKKLVGNKPNTFTYTKWLSETLLQQMNEEHNLPIAVLRPSTIGAAWKEPFAVIIYTQFLRIS